MPWQWGLQDLTTSESWLQVGEHIAFKPKENRLLHCCMKMPTLQFNTEVWGELEGFPAGGWLGSVVVGYATTCPAIPHCAQTAGAVVGSWSRLGGCSEGQGHWKSLPSSVQTLQAYWQCRHIFVSFGLSTGHCKELRTALAHQCSGQALILQDKAITDLLRLPHWHVLLINSFTECGPLHTREPLQWETDFSVKL